MSIVLIRSTAIVVELALKHRLHFCQLSERVEALVVLPGVCRIENSSTYYVLVDLSANTVHKHAGCSTVVTLTGAAEATRTIDILHNLTTIKWL